MHSCISCIICVLMCAHARVRDCIYVYIHMYVYVYMQISICLYEPDNDNFFTSQHVRCRPLSVFNPNTPAV